MEFSWTEFAESKDREYAVKKISFIKLCDSAANYKVEFNGSDDVGYWHYSRYLYGHEDLEGKGTNGVMFIGFRS